MPTFNPTRDEMLALVEQRAPQLPSAMKDEIAAVALAILEDPKRTDSPIMAVKLAIGRAGRARPTP